MFTFISLQMKNDKEITFQYDFVKKKYYYSTLLVRKKKNIKLQASGIWKKRKNVGLLSF